MAELLIGMGMGIVVALLVVVARAARARGSADPSPPLDQPEEATMRTAEELQRLERMLNEVDEGVLFFRDTGTVSFANETARRIFLDAGIAVGPIVHHGELMSVVRRAQSSDTPQDAVMTLSPARRVLSVRVVPGRTGEAVVVLRDISEEQRLALMRRQFVVNASHEMKTPVTAMQTLADAGRQALDADDLDAARRFLGLLGDESVRLGRVVQDLLDLSRVEDPTNIARASVDLSAVAGEVVDEYRSRAEAGSIRLKTSIELHLLVRGDASQLRLVIKNLVDNALRYTPPDESVLVEAFRRDGEVILRVVDGGIGIPLSAQSRVFERFFRVDEARDRARGGTGLGLSIVKHVVDLHGGRVAVESELGEGSTFTVSLPARNEGHG